MSSLARKKRNFIIAALIIPTVLLICFVVFPAIERKEILSLQP